MHAERLRALGFPSHRLHDARHFYAIREIRAGTPYELVARQLGHTNIAMVAQVYGRFAPRSDERDRWEKIAALQDEKETGMGTAEGTALGNASTETTKRQHYTVSPPSTFIIRH